MTQDASWRLEFGSTEWLALFGRLLAAKIQLDGDRTPRVLCEVYLNAPAHLAVDQRRSIAWTCRIDVSDIVFSTEECPDAIADVKTVGEYAAFRSLVTFNRRPDNDGEFTQKVTALVSAGQLRSIADKRTAKPAPNYAFHNLIAALTR